MTQPIEAFLDAIEARVNRLREARDEIGPWLSAALDEEDVCEEMKRDIRLWMDSVHDEDDPSIMPVTREVARLIEAVRVMDEALGLFDTAFDSRAGLITMTMVRAKTREARTRVEKLLEEL